MRACSCSSSSPFVPLPTPFLLRLPSVSESELGKSRILFGFCPGRTYLQPWLLILSLQSFCEEALGHVGRVIATTFESLEVLRERYSEIDETIAVLEKHFAEVHHDTEQQKSSAC